MIADRAGRNLRGKGKNLEILGRHVKEDEVWLVCGALRKAAIVKASIAATTAGDSLRILMFMVVGSGWGETG